MESAVTANDSAPHFPTSCKGECNVLPPRQSGDDTSKRHQGVVVVVATCFPGEKRVEMRDGKIGETDKLEGHESAMGRIEQTRRGLPSFAPRLGTTSDPPTQWLCCQNRCAG